MLSIIKQWAEALANLLPLAALLGAAGALCRLRGRPKLGGWLIASAVLVAYCAASPIVGDALIGPLERVYPPLRESAPMPTVNYIAVLGAGYLPHDDIPVTAALNQEGVVRVVEAIRLMRILGIAKLIVSGGAPPDVGRSALGYAKLARELGVPESSMIIIEEPQNTAEEARSLRNAIGDATFIPVTSAAHMPRAMRLMERVGAHAIPAPTGQLAVNSRFRWSQLFPNSGGLRKVEAATHEYLGLAVLATGLE